jgi:cupin fold WbuC family metalloprotein
MRATDKDQRFDEITPGTFYARAERRLLSQENLVWLKQQALANPAKRARICLHRDPADVVHEMVIALHRSSYIPPHCHPAKEESLHVIEGRARAVFFSTSGAVEAVVSLAPAGCKDESDRAFSYFYRIGRQAIHALRLDTEWLVYHEVAMGPFSPAGLTYPDWALLTGDSAAGIEWLDAAIYDGGVH